MVNQAKLFPSNDTNRVVHLFTALLQHIIHIIMLKLIFGHVLTVNSGCYGRCYIKKLILIPLCTFLPLSQCIINGG